MTDLISSEIDRFLAEKTQEKAHRGRLIFALDATTGKPLWSFQAGAPVYANPISYEYQGRQYLAITAGRSLISFAASR